MMTAFAKSNSSALARETLCLATLAASLAGSNSTITIYSYIRFVPRGNGNRLLSSHRLLPSSAAMSRIMRPALRWAAVSCSRVTPQRFIQYSTAWRSERSRRSLSMKPRLSFRPATSGAGREIEAEIGDEGDAEQTQHGRQRHVEARAGGKVLAGAVDVPGGLEKADGGDANDGQAHEDQHQAGPAAEAPGRRRLAAADHRDGGVFQEQVELLDHEAEGHDRDGGAHPGQERALVGGVIGEVADHRGVSRATSLAITAPSATC